MQPPSQDAAPVPAPPRALVADDSGPARRHLVLLLRALGFGADEAAHGWEAYFMAAQRRYDLVLLDCEMPELDGFEAARKLRLELPVSAPTRRDVRIVAVTAHPPDQARAECLASGMDDVLAKPVAAEALRRALPSAG